eukprot:CAMPEP_0119076984 /NCGR_PEP_ID=MMETSP1178-20130426/91531_1 /TAXON_ID=33656 /ORGANISM="unid sp, Strain CCMP2000" /LENGTH=55 /DNA_ID=CAMNT_0007059311 /DNA_START=10 /DNA_END=173 /DNA_ORIENTATION=+
MKRRRDIDGHLERPIRQILQVVSQLPEVEERRRPVAEGTDQEAERTSVARVVGCS